MHCVVKIILTGMSRVHMCVGMLNSLQSYNILFTYSHGKLFHNFSIILFPTFQCRVYIEVYGSGHMHAGLASSGQCMHFQCYYGHCYSSEHCREYDNFESCYYFYSICLCGDVVFCKQGTL